MVVLSGSMAEGSKGSLVRPFTSRVIGHPVIRRLLEPLIAYNHIWIEHVQVCEIAKLVFLTLLMLRGLLVHELDRFLGFQLIHNLLEVLFRAHLNLCTFGPHRHALVKPPYDAFLLFRWFN